MAANRKIASTKNVKTGKGEIRQSAAVEIVEEKPGMGWEGGVAIITTIVLLVAILCVDKDLGTKFGAGMFFK